MKNEDEHQASFFFFFLLENDNYYRWQDSSCRSNTIPWLFFVVAVAFLFLFVCFTCDSFTYWLAQLSEIQLRNSAPSRDLWIRIWSPFPTCLYSFMLAWPHCHPATCTTQHRARAAAQVFPETQQTRSSSSSQQTLDSISALHHVNVTERPLLQNWILFGHRRAGKGDTWLPAPVDVNISLDCLLFVGWRRVGERQRQVLQTRRWFSSWPS